MARDRKDRSANWFMEHHGGSLLRLAHVSNVVRWQAAHTVLGFPKQIPDGLLDVTFAGRSAPDPFLIEIETYPEQDTLDQIRKDLAMVLLTRGVVPDILLLVLCPKGSLSISPEQVIDSAHGLTALRLKIRVVNLWTVPAEELLAANDVGLIPWVPLACYEGPPDALLQECRNRIAEQGAPQERANLLAMTRVMAEARYNDPQLLQLFGETPMSVEKAILKLPHVQQVFEDLKRRAELEGERKGERDGVRKRVLRFLDRRFGAVPEDMALQLTAIQELKHLDDLLEVAAACPDLEAFRAAMPQQ